MDFKEGDKVICIDSHGSKVLKKGRMYTVKHVQDSGNIIINDESGIAWRRRRFIPAYKEDGEDMYKSIEVEVSKSHSFIDWVDAEESKPEEDKDILILIDQNVYNGRYNFYKESVACPSSGTDICWWWDVDKWAYFEMPYVIEEKKVDELEEGDVFKPAKHNGWETVAQVVKLKSYSNRYLIETECGNLWNRNGSYKVAVKR